MSPFLPFNSDKFNANPSIAVDRLGDVYVSYTTNGDLGGEENNNKGEADVVVFKLNTEGDLQWIKQLLSFNTTGNDYYTSIDVDRFGNVYVSYFTDNSEYPSMPLCTNYRR